jgi:hypothetical protein
MAPELLGYVSEIGLVRNQYPNSVRVFLTQCETALTLSARAENTSSPRMKNLQKSVLSVNASHLHGGGTIPIAKSGVASTRLSITHRGRLFPLTSGRVASSATRYAEKIRAINERIANLCWNSCRAFL